MAALAFPGGPPPGGRRSPVTLGRVALVGGIALAVFLIWSFFSAQIVSKRPNEMKTTQVILPPPPPPPPPEVKPQEKPPEPVDTPIEEPVDTPPPPDQPQQSSEPTQGDNALTAREGAGPSNYGLAVGDGGGTRIGSRPGGDNGFAAYGALAARELQIAAQADRDLSRGRYTIRLAVTVDAEGRITRVRVLDGGDTRRNARLVEIFTGKQLSRRPPSGLPVMRVELNARSGA